MSEHVYLPMPRQDFASHLAMISALLVCPGERQSDAAVDALLALSLIWQAFGNNEAAEVCRQEAREIEQVCKAFTGTRES
jgi:hypothetical protein